MAMRDGSLLRWFSVGCLAAASCLLLAPQTDAQRAAVQPWTSPAADAPAGQRAVPKQPAANPPVVKAVVERVDGLAGSIRYDGKKVVGVRCEKYPASDEDVKVFAGLTDLEELAVQGETVTDAAVGYLAGLPNLCDLSLEGTSITDEGVAKLKQLRGLRRLNLSRSNRVTDAALAHLAALPDLQYLELRDNNIGDAGLEHLKRFNKIRLLDVRGCQRVTDAGLGHLTGLMRLAR